MDLVYATKSSVRATKIIANVALMYIVPRLQVQRKRDKSVSLVYTHTHRHTHTHTQAHVSSEDVYRVGRNAAWIRMFSP